MDFRKAVATGKPQPRHVRVSFNTEQHGSHRIDFLNISYFGLFTTICWNTPIFLKLGQSDKSHKI